MIPMKWEDFCDEGAKLYIQKLKQELHQKENIIKEVREYIENGYLSDGEMVNILAQQELLEILGRENNDK